MRLPYVRRYTVCTKVNEQFLEVALFFSGNLDSEDFRTLNLALNWVHLLKVSALLPHLPLTAAIGQSDLDVKGFDSMPLSEWSALKCCHH